MHNGFLVNLAKIIITHVNSEIPTINNKELLNIGLLQKFSILSIDVVIGSIFCGAFVVKLLGIDPGFAWWFVLPTSVWIIYTIDHMIDGYKLKKNAHTSRHYFHFQYLKPLIYILLILAVISLILVLFFLEKQIVIFGVIAAFITGLYLFGVYAFRKKRSWFFQKELFVAIVYTLGIWGGPASLIAFNLLPFQWLCLIVFFMLVFTDLLVFSLYESETDRLDGHNNLVLNLGKKGTERLILLNIALVFLISIILIIYSQDQIILASAKIIMIMGFILTCLLVFQNKLSKLDLYRYIGEIIFWLPGLILLV